MRFSRCLHLATAVAAVALLAPRGARAQTWLHSWTLCTPGIYSCHSVSIETDAVLDNTNTRTGTTISIALHNLQGQYGADATTSSGLLRAVFLGPNLALTSYNNNSVPGVPSGVAAGNPTNPTWEAFAGTGSVAIASNPFATYLKGLIGGCGSNPLLFQNYPYGGFTCGLNAAFTFSFTIGDVVDANQFTSVYIAAVGNNNIGGTLEACYTDRGGYPCVVSSESDTRVSVTPEPVTLVLLGSGLLGIGGVGLRRRKRPLG